jgi:alpha-L-fucosidase
MREDFHSREGEWALGAFDNRQPWELCSTIAGAWGYQPGMVPRPLEHYIRLLVNVVGRDGNLLLNVGPGPDGRIDEVQAQRLREIGGWLGKYGDSIYATRGGPFLPGDYGASTYHGNTIYVHVLKWAQDKLVLPAIPARVLRASALTGGAVQLAQNAQGIELTLPAAQRDPIDTIIALELDSAAEAIGTRAVP